MSIQITITDPANVPLQERMRLCEYLLNNEAAVFEGERALIKTRDFVATMASLGPTPPPHISLPIEAPAPSAAFMPPAAFTADPNNPANWPIALPADHPTDALGMPWDPRIHDEDRKRGPGDVWKFKKGSHKAYRAEVEDELRRKYGLPMLNDAGVVPPVETVPATATAMIEVYSGSAPATADSPATGSLVMTLPVDLTVPPPLPPVVPAAVVPPLPPVETPAAPVETTVKNETNDYNMFCQFLTPLITSNKITTPEITEIIGKIGAVQNPPCTINNLGGLYTRRDLLAPVVVEVRKLVAVREGTQA